MSNPGVMVIKMSKMTHFFVFSINGTKKPVTVWTKYLCASERSHLVLLENVMDYWVLSHH